MQRVLNRDHPSCVWRDCVAVDKGDADDGHRCSAGDGQTAAHTEAVDDGAGRVGHQSQVFLNLDVAVFWAGIDGRLEENGGASKRAVDCITERNLGL